MNRAAESKGVIMVFMLSMWIDAEIGICVAQALEKYKGVWKMSQMCLYQIQNSATFSKQLHVSPTLVPHKCQSLHLSTYLKTENISHCEDQDPKDWKQHVFT